METFEYWYETDEEPTNLHRSYEDDEDATLVPLGIIALTAFSLILGNEKDEDEDLFRRERPGYIPTRIAFSPDGCICACSLLF